MSIPYDASEDPRLTAYALGELPASERAEVEALLARDNAARAFVEETRALAATLERELADAAPVGALSEAQRGVVRRRAEIAVVPGRVGDPAGSYDEPVLAASAAAVPLVVRYHRYLGTPARIAAAALVATVFLARHEIGAWWRGGEAETASAPRPVRSEGGRDYTRYFSSGVTGGGGGAPVSQGPGGGAQRYNGGGTGGDAQDSLLLRSTRGVSFAAGEVFDGGELATANFDRFAGAGGGGGNTGGKREGRALIASSPSQGFHGPSARALVDELRESKEEVEARLFTLGYVGGGAAGANREAYAHVADNRFLRVLDAPLSTFGADVDTASYANVRRMLNAGALPPPGAVRLEELVNYFPYRYAPPTDGDAFAVHAEVTTCPWATSHRLVRIALKGREVDLRERPPANLVFLIDVSGSMSPANKLPLLVQSMKRLVAQLDARDKVSIVVYAGAAGLVLEPTAGDRQAEILGALDRLQAGGSTNGGAGIELAYAKAAEHFVPGGLNRVILATDGDFNVGVSDESSLVRLIEEKAKSKVFLTVLGFGDGNYQDAKMEQLAGKGNGNYAYVDTLREGEKVLVEQAAGTLLTIAKDVKLQVEFNPRRVAEYRLLGYEDRILAAQDFADDRKDAGDVGAGHAVTALYEIVPAADAPAEPAEPLRYQQGGAPTAAAMSGELLTVKLRWKAPEGDVSVLRERPVADAPVAFDAASEDTRFAAAVAAYGMLLRGSPHKGAATWPLVDEIARSALGPDAGGHRAEFVTLARRAAELSAGR